MASGDGATSTVSASHVGPAVGEHCAGAHRVTPSRGIVLHLLRSGRKDGERPSWGVERSRSAAAAMR